MGSTLTRWSMSLLCRSCRFHRCRSWRRQSRSHSCRSSRKSLRSLRSRRSRAPRPLRFWALHLSARWLQRKLWRWSRSERLCPQNPHHPCSSLHPSWKLLQLHNPLPLWSTWRPHPRSRMHNPLPLEYVAPAPAVAYAQPAPVVEYVAPAPTVVYAAPVITMTAAPTVFPTATVPIATAPIATATVPIATAPIAPPQCCRRLTGRFPPRTERSLSSEMTQLVF